jgi:hypothetical protein
VSIAIGVVTCGVTIGDEASNSDQPQMSPYEAQAWVDLGQFWQRKAERRSLPPKAKQAKNAATAKIKGAASTSGGLVRRVTPQSVKDAGGMIVDLALEPTVRATIGLLEWVTETVQEFSNPEGIYDYHRDQGRPVATLADVRALDLQHLDEVTRRFVWRCRTTGVVEGAALGLVTFVPVAGSVAAIGLDLVIMHALSTAIATRAAYAYGLDPTNEEGRDHLDRMLLKAWKAQVPKAGTVKSAKAAFVEGAGRVRWSEKFRTDHRIAAAMEKLMQQASNGQRIPIDKVVAKMPAIGVITSAGINGTVLGSLADTSVRYSQTVHLAKKHNLVLPPNLI